MDLRNAASYWLLSNGMRDVAKRIKGSFQTKTLDVETSEIAKRTSRTNAEFRGINNGQRCFILATGPSIKQQDLSRLRNEICIGTSFFFLHPEISVIKPRYYVLAPNHAPFDFELIHRYIDGANRVFGRSQSLFYGHYPYRYSVLRYLAEVKPKLEFDLRILNFDGSKQSGDVDYTDEKSWDIARNPFRPRTVVYSALQVAAYMGFTSIYLVGCDHDYLQDLGRSENHFYAEKHGNPADREHLKKFTTEKWFEEYYLRWRDYRLISDVLLKRGVKVFNATRGGHLDVFPRVSLDDVLNESAQRP